MDTLTLTFFFFFAFLDFKDPRPYFLNYVCPTLFSYRFSQDKHVDLPHLISEVSLNEFNYYHLINKYFGNFSNVYFQSSIPILNNY